MTKSLIFSIVIGVCSVDAGAQTTRFDGFYAGGSIGTASGSVDLVSSTIDTGTYNPVAGTYFQFSSVPAINAAGQQQVKSTVLYGGGQGGYNWRSGRLLLGAEADFGAMGIEESVSATGIYPCCTGTFVIDQSIESDWVMTARPRVGYVVGGWLFYGTGGIALTRLHYRGTFNDSFGSTEDASINETVAGWTVGGGAEYEIAASRWSLSFVYLYADFGSTSVQSTNLTQHVSGIPLVFPNAPFTHTVNLQTHVVRFGVNYRF
jgi:outer membrane immunogenic protein